MVGRHGPRLPLAIAGAGMLAGSLLLTGVGPGSSFAGLVVAYVVFGLGFGFVNAPITNAAVSGMPRAQAGVAAAIATTSRQVGQTLGVAVVGAIAGTQAAGLSAPAWWALVGCAAVVLVLGLVATTARAHASARRTASELNPEALVA
jgi:MFS family permease